MLVHETSPHNRHRATPRAIATIASIAPALAPAFVSALLLALTAWASPAQAYIGPGAGFALGGSFLFAFVGFLLALAALFMWPVRLLLKRIRGRGRRKYARARRVVMLGLDGLDPCLARRWMREGHLPNLARLKAAGGFRPLGTTLPAMSPVAWSSFSTGVDASRHNIYDFLSRDPRTHLPVLSSTRVTTDGRVRRIGRWVISRGKPRLVALRRSVSFWRLLAERGVGSTVLRVPITFPPEKFGGNLLSAMCVPDLRGTQGTFSHYSSVPPPEDETIGGERLLLRRSDDGVFHGELIGPDLPAAGGASGGGDGLRQMTLPVSVTVDPRRRQAQFTVDGQRFTLGETGFSPWIAVKFRAGRASAHGICKFRVTSWEDPFSFYVTPIHIDPEHPSLPISHPPHYAIALAKLHGPYATLGLAEDTWGLNERVLDEQAFLELTYTIHQEREQQFFHALDRQREGLVAIVFDATDRIQHMFFRYLDPSHPANRGKDGERHRDAVLDLYRRADDLVGRTLARLGRHDVLFIVSDHGFKQFQRGVNLNSWFRENGYLFLKDDPLEGPLPPLNGRKAAPHEIDWSRTRAYTNGLGGAYLNLRGREQDGCVDPAEAAELKRELARKLRGLRDPERGSVAIGEVWDAMETYHGPYRENAPDLLIGYRPGYRADWDAAVGLVTGSAIVDNMRSWSGDHCMDPRQVPGVLFCSRTFRKTRPALVDLAPSILELFGIRPPAHFTGSSIFEESQTTWHTHQSGTAAGSPAPVGS
jgi:predicted AlkP superfamily phosphohydrolase/phosphomutase